MLGRLSLGVPPFPGMVGDANSKPGPGKGAENNPAVLDVRPLLTVQAESPQVTVNEEVQPGLRLRESGCRGIANRKCVEPSNLSEMYSEDALKNMNEYENIKRTVKEMEPDAPLDNWLLCTMWTHATPHVRPKHRSTYLLTFHYDPHGCNLAARKFHPSTVYAKIR